MSELIKPPSNWSPYMDLTASDLQSAIGDRRPISVKTYLKDQQRLYCGILVKDDIPGLGFNPNIKPSTLAGVVRDAGGRLISLDAFWDDSARELRCAAIWIKNIENWVWGADVDMDPVTIVRMLGEARSKLACLRVYDRPADENQYPPIAWVKKYCAIWIPENGRPWGWEPAIEWDALGLRLDDEAGQLVSIDCHPLASSADGVFAAVWWKDEGDIWFWNDGLDATAIKQAFPKFCSYGLDLVSSGPDLFASVMCQFPKSLDTSLATLVDFTGSANATFGNDLFQSFTWSLDEKNLTASQVRHTHAVSFFAAEGGWSWWFGNFTNPPGQTITGLPLVIPPGPSTPVTPSYTYSMNFKYGIFGLQLTDDAGKHQDILAQTILTQSSFPTPAPLPLNWPVYIGLIEPVEAVRLTNGKIWVSVLGQVCNPTDMPLTVTTVSSRVRFQSTVLHHAYLTDKLRIDLDSLGNAVDPPKEGTVEQSTAPFPKFIDAFEVWSDFTTAKLKVDVNIKFDGTLDCHGDTREVDIAFAPVATMPHLPYDEPVWGDKTKLRWHWGSGIGATGFTSHSSPEHRYSYDLAVWDSSNNSFKSGGDPTKNEDYYCWNQPIRAMQSGVIQFVDDSHPDNAGNSGGPPGAPNNFVIIYTQTDDVFQIYAHMIQGSAIDKDGNKLVVGASIQAGDLVGRVGNAGQTSEPHLHVGIARRDRDGFLRSLPMSFRAIKDSSGRTVSGVPVDGEFYSS